MTLSPDVNNPAQNVQPGAQAYPQQPPQPTGRKVSAPWTGALLALGALVGAIATFLPFEKIIVFRAGTPFSTTTFSGFGSRSGTGTQILNVSAANGGKIILAAAVVGLLCGLVIVAGKGRLWASIIGLIAVIVAGFLAVMEFGAVKDDQKTFNKSVPQGWLIHTVTKIGVDVASIGLGVAVIAAILAICIRRRRAA